MEAVSTKEQEAIILLPLSLPLYPAVTPNVIRPPERQKDSNKNKSSSHAISRFPKIVSLLLRHLFTDRKTKAQCGEVQARITELGHGKGTTHISLVQIFLLETTRRYCPFLAVPGEANFI